MHENCIFGDASCTKLVFSNIVVFGVSLNCYKSKLVLNIFGIVDSVECILSEFIMS